MFKRNAVPAAFLGSLRVYSHDLFQLAPRFRPGGITYVPECPVFSILSMRLTQATTSCEDGFEGLSRLITPDEIKDLRSRLRGVPGGCQASLPNKTEKRHTSNRYRRKMSRPHKQLAIILEEQWPIRRIDHRGLGFWLDDVLFFVLFCGRHSHSRGVGHGDAFALDMDDALFMGLEASTRFFRSYRSSKLWLGNFRGTS